MAKKHRGHDEPAWRNAKTICRLNARQVEMARALGMNPRKLPGLRPSAQQRWKLPVGAFIEQCYRKRFGGHPQDPERAEPEPRSRERWPPAAHAPDPAQDPMSQAEELVCYLTNLADDLQKWLVHGAVTAEVLRQAGEELRDIAKALDTGAPISPMPGIPVPPRRTRTASSWRGGQERPFDDEDEIPF